MLDIKAIRQDPQRIVDALAKRSVSFDVSLFQSLDARRKEADIRAQGLLADRKSASKKIGELVSAGRSVDEAKAEVEQLLARIAQDLEAATLEADTVQAQLDELLQGVPNVPDNRVPYGESESDNEEILRWGEPQQFAFEPKDHVDLGEGLGLMDMEAAGQIAGSRFSLLKGDIARLHRALIQFMLDQHTLEHGYSELYVPYIVNEASLIGTGPLPTCEEDLFKLEGDQGFYLAPTAEVPVTNMARGKIYEAAELAGEGIRYVAHT
ncbi:MAG: serine--tRNA ligase, partial [Luminiphilus sp.]